MKYKKVFLAISIVILIIICIAIQKRSEAENRVSISSFPETYRPYLEELQKKYPNWNFIPLYINLDWNYVIDQENQFGKSLVPKSYSDSWKNTNPGEYNVEVDKGWVDCSRQALEYTMDPRNFLNEVRIFQFEGLSYDSTTDNIDVIEKILYGTEFYNCIVQYKNSWGSTITMSNKYSELISKAGRESSVSSYHLASRIKQEVGPFLSHSSISGTVEGYEGYYNFYNIGATSSAEPMGAIKNGLQYAKDGKGASQSTKDKYLIPWDNKEKAITGGAIFIGSSYINKGQNTIYLQKFHVKGNSSGSLFWHQYMTNILAPYSEGKLMYNGYVKTGILNDARNFIIPIYNNMPYEPVSSPNIKSSDFVQDNTRVYADVSNVLNVRTGPSTSYEVLTTVNRDVVMTRIAKGVQAGELWDKVRLPNGMVGYVFQNYMRELPPVPQEEITGWNIEEMKVRQIKEKLSGEYKIEIVDFKGNVLSDEQLAGTGSKIRLIDNNNNIKMEYVIVIYGDVEGDGKINSIDLLVLQRHILEIEKLTGVFIKAGDISKTGVNPSSFDSLLIQRHILGLKLIQQ